MPETISTYIPEGRYLSKKQAAEAAGVIHQNVQYWIQRGQLPAIEIPGLGYLISETDLQAFLEKPRSAGYPKGRPRK